MGILTLGLLGVAALFPVGGYYIKTAEIADRGSAIAQTVMNDIVARGILNPHAWQAMVPVLGSGAASTTFAADGKFSTTPSVPQRGSFMRPFGLALTEALNQPTASTDATLIGKQFGAAFVIDPIAVAQIGHAIPNAGFLQRNVVASAFPAAGFQAPGSFYSSNEWQPFGSNWPIRRVTFQQPTTGWQMNSEMSYHFFRGNDDLTTDLPQRDDRPASQNWDIVDMGGTKTPLARSGQGDYSWIVSVAPTTRVARDGMARDSESHAYDVSVVVFYKRVLPDTPPMTNPEVLDVAAYEPAVKASVVSTGLVGGELLLTDLNLIPGKNPFEQLKKGQWIMLCGPHPNSNEFDPRFVMNWYQVLAIDSEPNEVLTNPATQRVVTVRGPQWPWQPVNLAVNALSNSLCVGICPGVVAVHTKTVRLEGPRGTAGAPLGPVSPPNTPDPPVVVY